MHGTLSQDSPKLNASTSSHPSTTPALADGTDVRLGEGAGMGTPRCELRTFSQAVDIPQDPCPKGSQPQDHPFPAQQAPPISPCPSKAATDRARDSLRNLFAESAGSHFLSFCFLSSGGSHPSLSNPHHADIQPPVGETSGHAACPVAYDKHEPVRCADAVQLRSGTASKRNAIYNRTNRLSLRVGLQACTVTALSLSVLALYSTPPPRLFAAPETADVSLRAAFVDRAGSNGFNVSTMSSYHVHCTGTVHVHQCTLRIIPVLVVLVNLPYSTSTVNDRKFIACWGLMGM